MNILKSQSGGEHVQNRTIAKVSYLQAQIKQQQEEKKRLQETLKSYKQRFKTLFAGSGEKCTQQFTKNKKKRNF